jgi:hypothetical protein
MDGWVAWLAPILAILAMDYGPLVHACGMLFQGIVAYLARLQRLFGLGMLTAVNSFVAIPNSNWRGYAFVHS